jgi:hypothetical protein
MFFLFDMRALGGKVLFMTTHEAAQKISAALNAKDEFAAKVWQAGTKCRLYIQYKGKDCGYLALDEERPLRTVSYQAVAIERAAEEVIGGKISGRDAVSLERVSVETFRPTAGPRDENEAQAREDGEEWIDADGYRRRPGT